jgi:acetylornithine/succinyldiaminopimelate/putrescine aminotransferase
VDSETAAVIIEPIQSMAGVREAAPEYFRELRALCDERGALLIFDEVQTGIGRTGHWFFGGSANAGGVEPDIITLAKSLASGVPVGACLVSEAVSSVIKENDLGTTFGGGMLAMAALLATLEAIENDAMISNAGAVEAFVRKEAERWPHVRSIKGKGCLLGIEFDAPVKDVHARLLQEKIITGTSSDPNVLRLLPPLSLPLSEIGFLSEVLNEQ